MHDASENTCAYRYTLNIYQTINISHQIKLKYAHILAMCVYSNCYYYDVSNSL